MNRREPPIRMLVLGVSTPLETFLQRLFTGLEQKGVRITLFAPGKQRRFDSVTYPRDRWQLLLGSWRILLHPVNAVWLYRQYASIRSPRESLQAVVESAAILGFHWDLYYFPWNLGAIAHLPLVKRFPAIVSCRGAQINIAPHNPERRWIRGDLKESFKHCRRVHCVCESIKQNAGALGLNPDKAAVIRPAVPVDDYTPSFPAPGVTIKRLKLVTVGSLIWRKGLEYALHGVSLAKAQGIPVQFDIVGTGNDRQRLLYVISELGLGDCVRLAGERNPAEVSDLLHTADVFVFTSLSEGISNAVLEAMAAGKLVITTDVDGMGEVVRNGENGLLIPPRDGPALRDALVHVWNHPELLHTLGKNARKTIEDKHNVADQVEAFHRIIEEASFSKS